MRKRLLFGAVVLFTIAFFSLSCSKDDETISCTEKLGILLEKQSSYVIYDTDRTCIAYKDALEDYINCEGVELTDINYYQDIMENLPCY